MYLLPDNSGEQSTHDCSNLGIASRIDKKLTFFEAAVQAWLEMGKTE